MNFFVKLLVISCGAFVPLISLSLSLSLSLSPMPRLWNAEDASNKAELAPGQDASHKAELAPGPRSCIQSRRPNEKGKLGEFEFEESDKESDGSSDDAPPSPPLSPAVTKKQHCGECGKSISISNWARHARKHSQNFGVKAGFVCNECGSGFDRRTHLTRHCARRHSPDLAAVHACSDCPKKFKVRENLFDHIRDRHREMASRTCPDCQRRFSRPAGLKAHRSGLKCIKKPAQALAF